MKDILVISLEFNISTSLVAKTTKLLFKVVNSFSFPSSLCFYRVFVPFSLPINFLKIWFFSIFMFLQSFLFSDLIFDNFSKELFWNWSWRQNVLHFQHGRSHCVSLEPSISIIFIIVVMVSSLKYVWQKIYEEDF